MARSNTHSSPLRFLLVPLVALVIVCGVYALLLHQAIANVRTHADAATSSYNTCMQELDEQQFEAALTSLHTSANEVAETRKALDSWQFIVADKLPVIGDDVRCARQTVDIADRLSNKALIPIVSSAEEIWGNVTTGNPLETIPNAVGKIPALYTTIADARVVVSACKADAQNLPNAHLDDLNVMVENVRRATKQADDAFATFDMLLEAADTLGTITDLLADPAAVVETTSAA